MAKPSPLQAIRRKAAAQARLSVGALPNSGYSKLKKANHELQYGRRTHEGDDGEEEDEVVVPRVQKKTRTRKVQPRKQTKTKRKATPEPSPEPKIENWRPAGGEVLLTDQKEDDVELTNVLGIARIPTWRVDAFTTALKAMIASHGVEFEDVMTRELEHGGESLTDVSISFSSELVAELVKDGIDGELLEGRKLQVKYA